MTITYTSATIKPGAKDPLGTVVSLLEKSHDDDYYAYERDSVWYVGLGIHKSLVFDSTGSTMTLTTGTMEETRPVTEPLDQIADTFVRDNWRKGSRIFGQTGFNYAAHIRSGQYDHNNNKNNNNNSTDNPEAREWPLLALMVPRTEICFHPDRVIVMGYNNKGVSDICAMLMGGMLTKPSHGKALCDRKPSTAASRSFSLKHAGFQATGFSPELGRKREGMQGMGGLEEQPRDLDSGAVLMLESPDSIEAALVLRTVFEDVDSEGERVEEGTNQGELLGSCGVAPLQPRGVQTSNLV